MITNNRFPYSIIGGILIGLGVASAHLFLLDKFGHWGFLWLLVLIPMSILLILLWNCLPYYLEERRAIKKYEERIKGGK